MQSSTTCDIKTYAYVHQEKKTISQIQEERPILQPDSRAKNLFSDPVTSTICEKKMENYPHKKRRSKQSRKNLETKLIS